MHSEKNVMNLKVKKPFYVTTVATALSNTYQVVRWPQTMNHPKRNQNMKKQMLHKMMKRDPETKRPLPYMM